jgi:hypothetical protein
MGRCAYASTWRSNVTKPPTESRKAPQWPPRIERERRSQEPRESDAGKRRRGRESEQTSQASPTGPPKHHPGGSPGHARRSPRQRGGRASVTDQPLRVGLREQRQTGPGTPQLDRKGAPRPCHNKRSIPNEVAQDHYPARLRRDYGGG